MYLSQILLLVQVVLELIEELLWNIGHFECKNVSCDAQTK